MLADILATILAAILISGGLWYLLAFARYMRSGQYTVDKRFWDVTH
jgi:hypothetical protein